MRREASALEKTLDTTTALTAASSAKPSAETSSAARPGLSESRAHTNGGDKVVAKQVSASLTDDTLCKIIEEGRHISGFLAHPPAGSQRVVSLLLPGMGNVDSQEVVVAAMSNDPSVSAIAYTTFKEARGYVKILAPESWLKEMADVHGFKPKVGTAVPHDHPILGSFLTEKETHFVALVPKWIAVPNGERPAKGKMDESFYCVLETISGKHLAWQLAHERFSSDIDKALTDNASALGK